MQSQLWLKVCVQVGIKRKKYERRKSKEGRYSTRGCCSSKKVVLTSTELGRSFIPAIIAVIYGVAYQILRNAVLVVTHKPVPTTMGVTPFKGGDNHLEPVLVRPPCISDILEREEICLRFDGPNATWGVLA